ncbi:UNVERIFIED_CONTAM: hypothetical protein K2H54_005578 [Gekko kuhli]
MTTGDERFVAESRHLELTPLDSCHYQVRLFLIKEVISQLQSSCTDLSEEELAKLGVSLFNCQARVEGRRTYPCTTGMTLAECTAEMDPDTWNAYHIVSNRARAVCYMTRQMQFKRQTEHTVNALVSTAVGQLEAMKMLKDGQEELKELTSESLQNVVSSQQEMLTRQARLQGGQDQMEESIHSNLDRLAQEKALIASGHQQVAQLIEGITKRMENVSRHLYNQDMDLQEGHKAILKDLTQVQDRAQEVYSKLESNLGLFLAYQNQTTVYYEELMGKLQKMNQSLGLVLFAMERMQSNMEGRFQHLQRFISWAGNWLLERVCRCALRGRLQKSGLAFLPRRALGPLTEQVELKGTSSSRVTSTPDRDHDVDLLSEVLEKLDEMSNLSGQDHAGRDSSVPGEDTLPDRGSALQSAGWNSQQGHSLHAMSLRRTSLIRSTRHEASVERFPQHHPNSDFSPFASSRACVPNESLISDISNCSMSPRTLCQGTTKTGQQCRKKALLGHVFCRVHVSGQASYTS